MHIQHILHIQPELNPAELYCVGLVIYHSCWSCAREKKKDWVITVQFRSARQFESCLIVISITKGCCSRCHVWHTHDPKSSMQCSKYSWVGDGGYPTRLSSFQQGCLQNRLVQMTEICSRISASHAESSGGLLGICGPVLLLPLRSETIQLKMEFLEPISEYSGPIGAASRPPL